MVKALGQRFENNYDWFAWGSVSTQRI